MTAGPSWYNSSQANSDEVFSYNSPSGGSTFTNAAPPTQASTEAGITQGVSDAVSDASPDGDESLTNVPFTRSVQWGQTTYSSSQSTQTGDKHVKIEETIATGNKTFPVVVNNANVKAILVSSDKKTVTVVDSNFTTLLPTGEDLKLWTADEALPLIAAAITSVTITNAGPDDAKVTVRFLTEENP